MAGKPMGRTDAPSLVSARRATASDVEVLEALLAELRL
jgi:hypothetical protein